LRNTEAGLDHQQITINGIQVVTRIAEFARKAADVRNDLFWALASVGAKSNI
jgi:hypothetical protein